MYLTFHSLQRVAFSAKFFILLFSNSSSRLSSILLRFTGRHYFSRFSSLLSLSFLLMTHAHFSFSPSLPLSVTSLCHILSSRTKRTSARNFFSKNLLSRVTVFQDGERRLLAESASNFNPCCTPPSSQCTIRVLIQTGGKEGRDCFEVASKEREASNDGISRVRFPSFFLHRPPKGY